MSSARRDTGLEEVPLLSGAGCEGCSDGHFMEFDEDGSLALARALGAPGAGGFAGGAPERDAAADVTKKPCQVGALNGSWYLQLTPKGPHVLTEIRGPMRIEVAPPKLRVSGDIYVRQPPAGGGPVEILRPITERPLLFGKNWYPQFSIDQYSWYFRSLGVTYQSGKLVFKFERYLWNRTTQDFIAQSNSGKDNGFMQLDCREGNLLTHPLLPQPTLRLTGVAQLGGDTYDVVATKTSPFYRGCAVEVDVMIHRAFPMSAQSVGGAALTFAGIYRTAGVDCAVTVDQTDLPEDAELTTIELQTALTNNRRPPAVPDAWQLWLLVGSSLGDETFGLMFDDVEPFREGTAGFFDPRIPASPIVATGAQNKRLGEVPEAFLRTLVHEAGHAFNLFHPKSDVHNVPIGTTIMNQTGDVMGFSTPSLPYPNNVTFAFDEHSRTSLIHSPDPQVAPGWKRFGWGHGSLSSGIAEPVDAAGFLRQELPAGDLTLELRVPENVFRGEFVSARFTVTNRGNEPRTITSAINLSQGDLRLLLKPPTEELHDVRDVIIACGDRARVTLAPGESINGSAQIFYTNVGFTFRQTGRHFVSAELDLGDGTGAVARSNVATVVVRAPDTVEEQDIARLSMTLPVGRAFAFGDFGTDEEARRNLEELADRYGSTPTGAAAALTLANAHGRDLRDLYSGRSLRGADRAAARSRFNDVANGVLKDNPRMLVRLATAVAAPTEANAPVLDLTADHLTQAAPAVNAAEGLGGEAAADTPKAGRRRRKGEPPADAPATPTPDAAGALDLLSDIRRSYSSGR
jgi:hypothetical protein